MANWFEIISIHHIVLVLVGFIVGRFWRLGKKIMQKISDEGTVDE